MPVPPVVSEETFAQVQAKLDANQQGAARNTRHEYLLRALISCGACRLGCTGRQTAAGYRYYLCRGRTDPLRVAQGERCTARYIPAAQLDELVWADLCALLTDPAQVTRALARAQGGAWLPQELQARQATIGQALGQLERQQQRLLDAYLAEVITLPELDRKRQDLDRRRDTLLAQQRQLDAAARQRLELGAVADGIEAFCQAIRAGLATATFTQRRQLAELLIDRVIVTNDQVQIRYVLPTSPDGPHRPFCQLRKDHLDLPAGDSHGDEPGQRDRVHRQLRRHRPGTAWSRIIKRRLKKIQYRPHLIDGCLAATGSIFEPWGLLGHTSSDVPRIGGSRLLRGFLPAGASRLCRSRLPVRGLTAGEPSRVASRFRGGKFADGLGERG